MANSEETKEEVLEEILENLEQEAKENSAETEAESDTEETKVANDDTAKGKSDKKTKKKADKVDKRVEALEAEIADLKDRDLRRQAEFDNFRKRTEKEKTAMFETGARNVIEKILPVVDNFERGLATIPEDEAGSAFAEGMNMIYKQLMTELDKMEVKAIEAVGQEFNPELHNAVMQVESEEFESGVIAQELQRGYTYRDTVVRHSMVAVVQ